MGFSMPFAIFVPQEWFHIWYCKYGQMFLTGEIVSLRDNPIIVVLLSDHADNLIFKQWYFYTSLYCFQIWSEIFLDSVGSNYCRNIQVVNVFRINNTQCSVAGESSILPISFWSSENEVWRGRKSAIARRYRGKLWNKYNFQILCDCCINQLISTVVTWIRSSRWNIQHTLGRDFTGLTFGRGTKGSWWLSKEGESLPWLCSYW